MFYNYNNNYIQCYILYYSTWYNNMLSTIKNYIFNATVLGLNKLLFFPAYYSILLCLYFLPIILLTTPIIL